MKTQAVHTRNYRRFYVLLNQMPGDVPVAELKEMWVSDFTNSRTTSVQEMTQTEFSLMIGTMEQYITDVSSEQIKLDKARKRVIAAIGAWLRSRNKTENIAVIKAIACRAAKVNDFNAIPIGKLRALYEEWCNKNKISLETEGVILEIESSLALMN